MTSTEWPEIETELRKVLTIDQLVSKPHGIVEIHGRSELFIVKPIEGSTPLYDCIFTTKNGQPMFVRFDPVP